MTSIVRPTSAQTTRRLIVLASALFGVLIAQAQMVMGWGQSQAAFAAQGDSTVRAAGYAFAVWGLLYLGILAYAVRQALPGTGESEVLNRLGWPSVVAFLAIGWWIVAAAFDWRWMTVGLILVALAALAVPLATAAPAIRLLPRWDRDRMLTVWPLAALAGWLTVASALNVLTVATAEGALPAALSPTAWSLLAVVLVVLATLAVTARIRVLAYPLPVAWGLLAVFVAEQERNPALAFPALAAAVIVLLGGLALALRLKPGVER